jgi:hypothetical protein
LLRQWLKLGLLFTPLIDNSQDFAALYTNSAALASKRIRSFVISAYAVPWLWQQE